MNMTCEVDFFGALPLPCLTVATANRLSEPPDVPFWANIYTMEITSDECLTEVQSLLSCPSNVNVARSFRGTEAQTLVDFLDQVG